MSFRMSRNDIISRHKLRLSRLSLTINSLSQILDDISGNCYVENLCAPQHDPCVETRQFVRTREQDRVLGIYEEETTSAGGDTGIHAADPFTLEHLHGEVLQFNTNCSNCNAPCDTNMKVTSILYCCV